MQDLNTPLPQETSNASVVVANSLLQICILAMFGLTFTLFFQLRDGFTLNVMYIIAGIILVSLAILFLRRGYVETAGIIIASSISILVTLLATRGQGIYDIGVMTFPAILIIASLILRRTSVFTLAGLIILCIGWLVIGAVEGWYQPNYPEASYLRQFYTSSFILAITAIAVFILSNALMKSLSAFRSEIQERLRAEKALREAETMYRTLVEQISVVTYRDLPDENASIAYISPQIKNLIGYTQQEWTSVPNFWQTLVHPDDLARVLNEIKQYIKSGDKTVSEYRLRSKNSDWVWVRDESMIVRGEDGAPEYVHGVYIDITEKKRAELAVQQREAILSAVAETAQLLLKSQNWQDVINPILKLLGEATDASHVYIFQNHMGPDDVMLSSQKYEWVNEGITPELDNPVYQNTRLNPSTPGLEDWYTNLSNGKPFYGSGKIYPRYWKKVFEERGLKTLLDVPIQVQGAWWGVIGFDDFKYEMPWSQAEIDALIAAAGNLGAAIERQISDAALRVSEEKFQLAFKHTYVSMAISRTKDHTLLDINDAFCKVTGYSREEAIGKRAGRDLQIWNHTEDRNQILHALETRGFVDEYEAEFVRKNGDVGVGMLSAVNVTIAGEPCQLFSFYDISRIHQLVKELGAKNEELQAFTYTVSHDLRAPLITMSGFLGYLEQDAQSGNVERVLRDTNRIKDAVKKMERLLSELLELSRIGRMINPPEAVPFGIIVQDALQAVEGRLKAKQVEVKVAADLPIIHGDRIRLTEAIQNLVDNAAKFTGRQVKPVIEIGALEQENNPIFFVRDNGMGIEPEFHEKVFGLFNKLDGNSEGTGIGLALVKRIIEVHGGKIWVESGGKEKGTSFLFTLGPGSGEANAT